MSDLTGGRMSNVQVTLGHTVRPGRVHAVRHRHPTLCNHLTWCGIKADHLKDVDTNDPVNCRSCSRSLRKSRESLRNNDGGANL